MNDLFRNIGMGEDGAYGAVQEIRIVTGQNIVAKMDVQVTAKSAEFSR